jgi:hypothetical protein
MRTHQFDSIAELEEIEQRLARGSMHPVYVDLGADEHSETASDELDRQPDRFGVWNNRDDRRAYIASDRYELIQHREVIDTIRDAVRSTAGEIDKGVIRDYGSKIDGVLVFGNQEEARVDVDELVDGYVPPESGMTRDRIGLGMRFKNSWDGGTKVGGTTMGYRYICANWMVWGERQISGTEQLHVHELDQDFFANVILDVFDLKEDLAEVIVEAETTELPVDNASDVLEDAGFGRNYRHSIMDELADTDETTLWRLYQAVTTYLDDERVEEIGNGVYNSHHQRAWSVLTADVEAKVTA